MEDPEFHSLTKATTVLLSISSMSYQISSHKHSRLGELRSSQSVVLPAVGSIPSSQAIYLCRTDVSWTLRRISMLQLDNGDW